MAQQLAHHLVHKAELDCEIRWEANKPFEGGSKPKPARLTDVAHQLVAEVLQVGDVAIDATAGNGFDTRFLSEVVGPNGHVFAFDIQAEAIERTRAKLAAASASNFTLHCASHEQLHSLIPNEYHGQIASVMMNLGYLPRGDKELTTEATSTVIAIRDALAMLRDGGIITILAYTGHDGGLAETQAVEQVLRSLDREQWTVHFPSESLEAGPPRLYWLRRESS